MANTQIEPPNDQNKVICLCTIYQPAGAQNYFDVTRYRMNIRRNPREIQQRIYKDNMIAFTPVKFGKNTHYQYTERAKYMGQELEELYKESPAYTNPTIDWIPISFVYKMIKNNINHRKSTYCLIMFEKDFYDGLDL